MFKKRYIIKSSEQKGYEKLEILCIFREIINGIDVFENWLLVFENINFGIIIMQDLEIIILRIYLKNVGFRNSIFSIVLKNAEFKILFMRQ